jgi:hypothetical protein
MESQIWGTQIGGIQALPTEEVHPIGVDESPERLSADHQERVDDFMKRHGGPASSPRRHGRLDSGYRGWSEIDAADGYVLRTEWSRSELRVTLNVAEYSSSFSVSR